MGSSEEQYAAFQEKVKRTIYIDNLSPIVTEAVIRAAFNQFGTVASIQFITTYLKPKNMPRAALVEMENAKQAEEVLADLERYALMISGMPRPVRARLAEVEMFDDRPRNPGRRILACWLDPKDPDFEVAKKIKQAVKKHAAEASFMLEQQLEQEESLAKKQAETLKANYKKYKMIDSLSEEGAFRRLALSYGMRITDP